jgi:hypothetical protein
MKLKTTLVLDFDGTLILKDIFKSAFYERLTHNPFGVFKILFRSSSWVAFKRNLLEDLDSVVLNDSWEKNQNGYLIEWVQSNRDSFREIVVVSASPQEFIQRVIPEGIFDGIYGSTVENLKGKRKLEYILSHWGKNFAYVGDDVSDEIIFRESVLAYRIDKFGQMSKIKDVKSLD